MALLINAAQAGSIPPPNQWRFANRALWPLDMVGQESKPVRVFVVDDDAHIRRVITQALMADSRTLLVGQARSLREARKNMCQQEFDVLLVDLHLEDGEGLELLAFTHNVYPHVLAIVISVTEREDDVLRAFEQGAVGYLLKNSWFDDYAQAVLEVANGGASITPVLAKRLLSRLSRCPGKLQAHDTSLHVELLTQREIEVLRLVSCGYTSPEIAKSLDIGVMTVNTHIKSIYRKLQTHTRAQAVRAASSRGLI